PSVKGAKRLPIDRWNGFPLNAELKSLSNEEVELARRINGIQFVGRGFGSRSTPPEEAADAWEKATGLIREDYFATIPSLPISHDAARPILEALAGPNVPNGWQGGLPFAYHLGPGPAEVSFAISMEYKIRPVWNVIATIRGEVEPERWVLIG